MKRTALKRKTLLRSKSLTMRQVHDHLWELARELAFKAYGRACWKCGRCYPAVVMQVHHIIPKGRCQRLRYHITNLVPLCRGCHMYGVHGTDAREANKVLLEIIHPTRIKELDFLAAASKRDRKKFDPEAVRLYLEAELEKIQGSPNQPGR